MDNDNEKIFKGLTTAFINGANESSLAYRPEFLSNDYERGQKVLVSIENELLNCERFYISVAFITDGGVESLIGVLDELSRKNIPGKILTTDYQNFTDPKALRKLARFSNIELRIFRSAVDDSRKEGFHTKGYIFEKSGLYRIIIGSSNLTASALTANREWNVKAVSTGQGEFVQKIMEEWDRLWNSENTLGFDDYIDEYETRYRIIEEQRRTAAREAVTRIEDFRLTPNRMQAAFVRSLNEIRSRGEKKALLISATGTGKTYASAFAMRDEKQKRVLFLIHREQIARAALESYRRVLGSSLTYGILSGNEKDYDADYVFATVQTMAGDEALSHFSRKSFQTIIIDEVHHAAAGSYKKIIDYFQPEFLLGMTATPERTDGYDIYTDFDHNIAYEIRLQQALEENLLCPFHYFGVTDIEINGAMASDSQNKKLLSPEDFQYLTSDERVDYVLEKARLYGYSGSRVKGVIFVSRREIGIEISEKMNKRGMRTVFLSGDDRQEKREACIERLTSDEIPEKEMLDYIITVDIFNEGVDIPEINQVIMMRPTESPVIFVQQLGRGLRKAENKDYVVIIDFIGNYANNYMIPIALSGDRSYNKDHMRRFVSGGSRLLPGTSTIYIDEISRKRIFQSIDSAKTNDTVMLREAYRKLKDRLGRIPSPADFEKYGTVDIGKYFDKFGSYYHFLVKYEKDFQGNLDRAEEEVISFLSQKLTKGKRPEELLILEDLVDGKRSDIRAAVYAEKVNRVNGHTEAAGAFHSAIRNLTNQFAKDSDKKKYKDCVFLTKDSAGNYAIAPEFARMLQNPDFRRDVRELIGIGLDNYQKKYSHPYKNTNFALYQKYTYEDVCLLLNWDKNRNAQNLGGYFYDKETKQLPVFINYKKAEDAIAYEDRFESPENLIALSKHPRRVDSSDADHFFKRTPEDRDNRIYLFVRKNKDDSEAKEFYFLGEIEAEGEPKPVKMPFDILDDMGKKTGTRLDDAFEISYHLDVPVREDIYDYIVD
jgi:superfamily II DNA or RNA helicase